MEPVQSQKIKLTNKKGIFIVHSQNDMFFLTIKPCSTFPSKHLNDNNL